MAAAHQGNTVRVHYTGRLDGGSYPGIGGD